MTMLDTIRTSHRPKPSIQAMTRRLLARGLAFLASVHQRRRMRHQLLDLTDDQLRDVGITRDEALRAADRLRWRGDWT